MVNIKIPKINLALKIVTPLLLGGSISDARRPPELRAAPFRGQLRYWLRAKLALRNMDDLHKAESKLMGSTTAGSLVKIRVFSDQNLTLKFGARELLLHRPANRLIANGFSENQQIRIELSGRPLSDQLPQDIKDALLLWLYLGGVGKRCRRGMGSLQNQNSIIRDGDRLVENINTILGIPPGQLNRLDYGNGTSFPSIFSNHPASYPAFFPRCWFVVVCKEPFPSYSDALRDFWYDHLRSGRFRAQYAYGWVRKRNDQSDPDGDMRPNTNHHETIKRRASPFHLHIAQSEAGYHLVMTAFHALPDASPQSWQKTLSLAQHVWQSHHGSLFYCT
jgi:CRISPR type III-B/RAMP module RAMP protein Cmr1